MTSQITDTLMMVRPVSFGKNDETAKDNYYQKDLDLAASEIQKRALKEFDAFVEKLKSEGVEVFVEQDTVDPHTPDSVFPNNWVSFHDDGRVFLYPMLAASRRLERRDDILESLSKNRKIGNVIDLSKWELQQKFLEGTGSLILDRPNKIAYACLSERTNEEVLKDFEQKSGFSVFKFHAFQSVNNERKPIYHTNVMMFVGEKVAVVCLDSIDVEKEKRALVEQLEATGKEVISITESQVENFAGNMLQVKSITGEPKIVMSGAAFASLSEAQKSALQKHGKLVYSDLETIETLGGGSARCMMAEVFLPKNQ
jgi:hypothetical protein